jgi:hypothetical protein
VEETDWIGIREPWDEFVDDANQEAWEAELQRELSPGHSLYGRGIRGIARRHDRDDALFALDEGGWAVVHLTWSAKPEVAPIWPTTSLLATRADVVARIERDVIESR